MSVYFDSNILLAIFKKDKNADLATRLWEENQERCSSILLEAECLTVLRRTFLENRRILSTEWLAAQERRLQSYLDEMEVHLVDHVILDILRGIEDFSKCRALDAIHVATALHFQRASDEPFYFCSFDRRLAKLAESAGLKLLTAES